ncbi:MAG: hypothetical protein AAF447_05640 [Myxococcota bacterium]
MPDTTEPDAARAVGPGARAPRRRPAMRARLEALKRHRLFALAFAACSAMNLFVLWDVTYLPLLDWPQHVGLVSVVANAFDASSGTHAHYAPYLAITSYLTLYGLGALLTPLLGASAALKVLLSAYFLGLPASLAWLLRELGQVPWPALLAFVAGWCWPLYMGFVAFVLALPLGFACLALLVRGARDPTRATLLALALLAALLFFTHAMAYGWFVAVGGLWAVLTLLRRRRTTLARLVVAVLPSLGLFAVWFVGQFAADHTDRLGAGTLQIQSPSAAGGADVDYRPLGAKVRALAGDFNEAFRDDADLWIAQGYAAAVAALIALGLGLLVRRRAEARPGPRAGLATGWLLFALFAGLYFAMPMMANTIWAISPRVVVLAALAALLLAPPLFERERWNALVGVPLVALVAYTAATNHARFVAFQKETDGFAEVMAHAQPGRRLYGVMQQAGSREMSQAVFLHWPAYYMADPGGLVGFTFIINPTIPVQLRTLGTSPYPGRRAEWEPDRFRFDIYGAFYDYVLVRGQVSSLPRRLGADEGQLRLVHEAGPWGLYEHPGAAEEVVYSFFENVHHARVRQIDGDQAAPCTGWDGRGFTCPHAPWARVEPLEYAFEGRTQPCLHAHPVEGQVIEIGYEDVPAGGTTLRGFAGVADSGQSGRSGADVELRVLVDGVPVGSLATGSRPGYATFAFELPEASAPRRVVFQLRTEEDAARHFGFTATLLRE